MNHEVTGFEHLHRHSDFSLLDGFATVAEYAQRMKEINQKYLCITDHGVMGAVPQQISECDIHNLYPIFGCELYVNSMQIEAADRSESAEFRKSLGQCSSMTEESSDPISAECDELADLEIGEEDSKKKKRQVTPEQKKFDKSCHLLAIAYNSTGYSNLVKLTSWAWIHGYYRRPRVNHEVLLKYKEGIIFTSSCGNSEIANALFNEGEDAAFQMLEKYIAMFSPHFYLELMMLDWKMQAIYDAFLIKAHDKYNIPLIISQDCHYCKKEHSHNQRLMLMQQKKTTIQQIQAMIDSGDEDLFELQDTNLWLKSEDELNQKWESDYSHIIDYELYKQAKANTVKICELARGVQIDRSIKLPKMPDAELVLWDEIKKGFIARGCPRNDTYAKRIKEEYELICEKGFASYFLIQKQMTDEARRVGPILLGFGDGSDAVGPGRGCSVFTQVVMEDGRTCDVSEVKVGDKVVTIDGSFKKVTETFAYPLIDEVVLKIKSFYGDHEGVTITKDHKVLVEKGVRPKGYNQWSESTKASRKVWEEPTGKNMEWIPGKDIEVGDWVFSPIPQFETKDTLWDLSKYDESFANGSKLSSDDKYVVNSFNGGFGTTTKQIKILERFHKLDEQWACILGIFAGDGWLRSDLQGCVDFCFASHEFDNRNWVAQFFNNIGCEVSLTENKDGKLVDVLSVKSKHISLLFRELFCDYQYKSNTKHVPKCILEAKDEIIAAFLHGYFLSDGGEDDSKMKFVTVSKVLASQVRYLLLRLGIPSTLQIDDREDSREEFSGRTIAYEVVCPLDIRICSRQFEKKYVWKIVPNGILTQVREITEVYGVKEVYDFTVEDNHNYLTSSFLIHNSVAGSLVAYCLRLHDVEPIIHDLRFSRFLSPARGGKQMKIRHSLQPIPHSEIVL